MVFIRTNTKVELFQMKTLHQIAISFQVGDDRERPYLEYVSDYLWQIDEMTEENYFVW